MEAVGLGIPVVLGADPRPADEDLADRLAVVGQAVEVLVEDVEFEPRHEQARLGDVVELLVQGQPRVLMLHAASGQRRQRTGFRHPPTLDHLDVQGLVEPADQRRRRRRTPAGNARQGREVVGIRVGVDERLDALPDGRHAGRDRHPLRRHQRNQALRGHETMRHHLLAAEHECRPWQTPAHGVEHRHDAEQGIGRGQAHAVGHALGKSVQVLRAVLVLDTLGVPRRAAGVAEPERCGLVEFRPPVARRFPGDEILVVDGVGHVRGPVLETRLDRNHDAFNRRDAPGERAEQGQRVGVGDDQPVFGVADDVGEVGRRQANVEGMQHRAHAGRRVVRLEVPRSIPHERPHPVAHTDAGVGQGMGQGMGTVPGLGKRLSARPVLRGGHDFRVRRDGGTPVDESRHQQGSALHSHSVLPRWVSFFRRRPSP